MIAARTNACASLTCRTNKEASPDMVHGSVLSGAIRSSSFVQSCAEDVVSCEMVSDVGLDMLHSERIVLCESYIGGRVAVPPWVHAQSLPSTGIFSSLTRYTYRGAYLEQGSTSPEAQLMPLSGSLYLGSPPFGSPDLYPLNGSPFRVKSIVCSI